MEDDNMKKTNITKELIDLNEAPPLESNKIYYNRSECPSIIEIISITHINNTALSDK